MATAQRTHIIITTPPSEPDPCDPPPDPNSAQQRWDRMRQRAKGPLDLGSDDGLTSAELDRAQRMYHGRAQRVADADVRSMCSSDDERSMLDATSNIAKHPYLDVNLEERVPRRVYAYCGSELANLASTIRHTYIPASARLRGGGRDEEPPFWFMCAPSRAVKRFSVDWAAYEADRSLKEDLGFEKRGRRKNRGNRRGGERGDSSASSDAISRSEVLEAYKVFRMLVAAQKDKSWGEQIEAHIMAAIFEQMKMYRRGPDFQKAAVARDHENKIDATSLSDLEEWYWVQWQQYDAQRQAAFEREDKMPEWTRSDTRQEAAFEKWKKMLKEKNQKKEYFRLRGKEIATVRRSTTKRVTTLPSPLEMQKLSKMGKNEVNDTEWIDVPKIYEESGTLSWERRVRLLKK
ncbi:hypothetical protein N0V91_004944 [Didymella pomorum]|uniref:Uncharacterized protein n=1 Tax=Didymella pomorum TaxID=749634 RepID=A0A9W9D742_9PLEO|nr:hypothetical protein N0V91_004944 [Didymella pomorum]